MNQVADRASGAAPPGPDADRPPAPSRSSDAEIVARISAVLYEPFAEVWRRYEREAWLPLRRALEEAAAAHEQALAEFSEGVEPDTVDAPPAEGGVRPGGEKTDQPDSGPAEQYHAAREQYHGAVTDDIIEPLRVALTGSAAASSLEDSIASTADRVRASLAELPAVVEAPTSRPPAVRLSGVGAIRAVKRAVARVLGPLVWRDRVRSVAVARVARQHLDQVVLRAQASAFRRSQRDRAEWLGRLERAWAGWAAVVLRPARVPDPSQLPADLFVAEQHPGEKGRHRAAGAALQAELGALVADIDLASGRAGGADFRRLEELLAATVAVAGTFAADPPSSRPRAGRQQELAARWDAWSEGTAARLELYRSLVVMRRGVDGILRGLRRDWSRTVQNVDAALAEVAAELSLGEEWAQGLSAADEDLPPLLGAERRRTDAALARIQGTLPEPGAVFQALASAVEAAGGGLDAVRAGMPARLAVHDLPEPRDPPRQPSADPRAVRLREAFLHAFDTLRRERIRAASSGVREAMHRVRSEVSELREVAGYAYEAAIEETRERRDPDSPRPTELVTNGLSRAGNKAARARGLLREALAAAERSAAGEMGEGSRQLIEQVTADRVTAGYLEARTYLAGALTRVWTRVRRLSAQAGARLRKTVTWAGGLLGGVASTLSLGPAPAVARRREHSLAYAEEYPRELPVVYRRLFSLDPLDDGRLLAGRDDALAAVSEAWARRDVGEARSLIVIASPGAGVTSFLNVVASRLFGEAPDGVRRSFEERVREETQFATSLAGWLGFGDAPDLDSLAERVMAAPSGTVPRFVVLEATEHLHMRVPGGSRLLERLLTFMSRTESRVFWILGMTSSAWQLLQKRAPAFVHDVERIELGELSTDQLKQAVLSRHRLSGLPLRFAEPRDGRAALRRRTRRLRGAEKQEQLVEADYFQRLHRASQGSVRLALFHWLRSADFVSTAGSLVVQPLSTLDPGIERLDRTQCFTLKAILDHGTLTVEEHCEVARIPAPESLHILRSLEECRVIEKVSGPRYGIRPLMIGAVATHLRSRNILH